MTRAPSDGRPSAAGPCAILGTLTLGIALACGTSPAEEVAGPTAPPGCAPIFACETVDGRVLSLCQSAADPRALQYRFGPADAPELLWPPTPEVAPFRYDRQTWKGTIDRVTLTRGAFEYEVYALRTADLTGGTAGVQVSEHGRLLTTVLCATTSTHTLDTWGRVAFADLHGVWAGDGWTASLGPDGSAAITAPGPCGVSGTGRWEPTRDSGATRNAEIQLDVGAVIPIVQDIGAPHRLGLDCPVDDNLAEPDFSLERSP